MLTCSNNKDEPLFDEPSFAGTFKADLEDEIHLMPKSRPIQLQVTRDFKQIAEQMLQGTFDPSMLTKSE